MRQEKDCDCKNNWTYEQIRVSMCLTAEADGTKLPPLIVFKGAKQEISALAKEIKNCCIASSPSTWINTELTYMDDLILSSFSYMELV